MMADRDLDVVIAIDLSRDEIGQSSRRWLTGFSPLGSPAAALLHRDGRMELISRPTGMLAPEYYKAHGLQVEVLQGLFPQSLLADRIGRSCPGRLARILHEDGRCALAISGLGIVETASFPWALATG